MSDRQLRVVRTLARQSLVVLLAAAVSGCGSTIPLLVKKSPSPSTLQEGVTVSTSVVYVRPWAEVAAALSPKFANTPEAALGNVLNSQSFSDFRLLQSLGFSLQGGVKLDPISAVTDEAVRKVATKTTGDTTETTSDTTDRTVTTKKVDDNSPPAAGDLPASRSGSATGLPDQIGAARAPGTEPFFRYSTAAALYQEIGLLNDAVAGLPGFEGKTPYIIRLRVGVVPFRRDLPWDVYARLLLADGDPEFKDPMILLPILSSEAIEGTMDASALQQINEIRLGLQALAANAKVSGGFSRLNDNLTEFLTRTYSPSLQVTGSDGFGIDVKFSASRDKTGYALNSRNFYVTVVAYLDRPKLNEKSKEYRFHVKYGARDVETGAPISDSIEQYYNAVDEFIKNDGIDFENDKCDPASIIWDYSNIISTSGTIDLKNKLNARHRPSGKECIDEEKSNIFFSYPFLLNVTGIKRLYNFSSSPIEIRSAKANFDSSAMPLVQNSKDALIVDVPYVGTDQFPLEQLGAKLTTNGGTLSLAPRAITLRSAGAQKLVRVEFPALSAFKSGVSSGQQPKVADPRTQPEAWTVSINVSGLPDVYYKASLATGYIAAEQPKPAVPKFEFAVSASSVVRAADGTSSVGLYVKPPDGGRVKLSVQGADLMENNAFAHELVIAVPTARSISLRNVVWGQTVTLKAVASLDADPKATDESIVVLPVR